MNPTILEDVESLRLKLEKAKEITPELQREYDLMVATLNASIEAHSAFAASLSRLEKTFSKETNELCVSRSFINQVWRSYGNNETPGTPRERSK